MKTHRCKGSLEAHISMRKDFRLGRECVQDEEAWRMYHYVPDFDYDCMSKYYVAKIEYCPFCSEKLDD